MKQRDLRVWAALALPAVVLGALAWMNRWTSDDAFIHFRVVDQLLHGNGPVFNAGERVEASTSPAWVALLAMTRLITFRSIRLEYLALWLSLLGTVSGVVLASLGALRLTTRDATTGPTMVVPFGSLIIVALRPFWDFATSGLEMGLTFAWLGACFYALVVAAEKPEHDAPRWHISTCVLAGFGPLIRPDLALFSLCFVATLIALDRRSWWRRSTIALIAFAIPGAYQVFRMGYYAVLVPNTAIAKNAGSAQWHQGLRYLGDLVSTYQLWLPMALVAAVGSLMAHQLLRDRRRRELLVVGSVALGAMLHATYVVRVGGDFMHARLLLPAVFAIAAPVGVLTVRRRALMIAVGVLVVWGVIATTAFRFDITARRFDPIDDERSTYTVQAGVANPVTIDDYARTAWVEPAFEARAAARARGRTLIVLEGLWASFADPARRLELRPHEPGRAGLATLRVGAAAYAAGVDVVVIDRFGLGDAIGSHLTEALHVKPGHDKFMPLAWVEGRYASSTSLDRLPPLERYGAQLARNVMQCGAVAQLLRDVDRPLTLGRFFGNIADSFANTSIEIPFQPQAAADRFCARASVTG